MPTRRHLVGTLLGVLSIVSCKTDKPVIVPIDTDATSEPFLEQIRKVGYEPLALPQSNELTGRLIKLESDEGQPLRFTVRCNPGTEPMIDRGQGPQKIEASAGRTANHEGNLGAAAYGRIFAEHEEVSRIRLQLTDLELSTMTVDSRRTLDYSLECLAVIEEDLAGGSRIGVVKGSLAGSAQIAVDYSKAVSGGVKAQISQQLSAQYGQGVSQRADGAYVVENLLWGLKVETQNVTALCLGFPEAYRGRCKQAFESAPD